MKKRLLSAALALVMVCGLLPVTASAAATVTEIVPPKYDEVRGFSDGLAAVKVAAGEWSNGEAPVTIYKWGFIDRTGKEVVPIGKYAKVGDFSDGLAAVRDENNNWGFIDATGEEVVPCKYDIYYYKHRNENDAPKFHNGFAMVQLYGKYGFIDKTGKEIVPFKYDDVENFSESLAAVELDDKWGFIDTTGREVVPCKYDRVAGFSEGLAAVELDDKWGFIDKTGKEVVPCKYTANYEAPVFHEGFAVVKGNTGEIKNGQTVYAPGVFDAQGNVVVPFGKYDGIGRFSDGLAVVWLDDKCGFIDTTGKEVVPLKYDSASGFSEGLAAVEAAVGKREDQGWLKTIYKWGFIDTTGKEVVPCEYEEVGDFSEGLAAVKGSSGEKDRWVYGWGFVDKTGKEVVPIGKYTGIYTPVFHDGLAAVQTSNGWGCIDLQGNEVVPCQYGEVKLLSAGLVAVKLDGKWGVLRVEGLPTEPKPVPTPTPTPEPTTPTTYTAKATNDKLTVDGVSKAPTAYKINNANYFQLRDVAVLLNDTKAQFSVDYDDAAKAIKITTGQPYQPNGKEMKGAKATAEAIVGNNDVYINGVKTDFVVYKIGGSNFFQIRDLGKVLGFNVDWAKDVGIIIDPSTPYSGK